NYGVVGRYGISVPALHKRPRRNDDQCVKFRSSGSFSKELCLDESSPPKFDLFSDLEEHSEEEEIEAMAKTMEEYIGSDHEDANGNLEKALEIVDLFHIPNITQDQIMLRAFPITSRTRSTETSDGLAAIQAQVNNLGREIKKVNEKLYAAQLNKLIFKPRQATIPFPSNLYDDCYEKENGSYGLKDLDAYSIKATLRNDALPQKEKDPGSFTLPCYINNVCFEKSLADLGASVSVMPLSTYLNLGLGELAHTKLTVKLADRIVKYPKGIAKNVLVGIDLLSTPPDPPIVDVFKRKITLRVGDEKIIFKSVKPASNVVKRVYMLSLRERMDLDLEARLMGETLIINRSFDPLYADYIELNDIMDNYLDEVNGDVVVGEPFCKASCVEARRFDRIITIRYGNDSVTYQMVRSNPRFKHLTNEKCNKIPSLLKVSEQDKMNGISHSYQKLKGFYKGVFNLGPEFIRDAKVEEWLTREHISVHEME
ncbi:gag-pol polyprotein, partial [Tanacetum coccineum]